MSDVKKSVFPVFVWAMIHLPSVTSHNQDTKSCQLLFLYELCSSFNRHQKKITPRCFRLTHLHIMWKVTASYRAFVARIQTQALIRVPICCVLAPLIRMQNTMHKIPPHAAVRNKTQCGLMFSSNYRHISQQRFPPSSSKKSMTDYFCTMWSMSFICMWECRWLFVPAVSLRLLNHAHFNPANGYSSETGRFIISKWGKQSEKWLYCIVRYSKYNCTFFKEPWIVTTAPWQKLYTLTDYI